MIPFGSLSFSFGSLVVPIGVFGVHFGPRSFSFGSLVVSFGFVVDPFDFISFPLGPLWFLFVRCAPLGSPLFGECFLERISLPTIPWLQDNNTRARVISDQASRATEGGGTVLLRPGAD